jgi:C2H2-type zinc finger
MESVDDAACLLLSLSSGSDADNKPRKNMRKRTQGEFECKTCNRRFSSFQALGGHRTGHKRAKILSIKDILERSDIYDEHHALRKSSGATRKTHLHQCTICGEGFSMGQALGGHMRRHRADPVNLDVDSGLNMPLPSLEECGRSGEILAIPSNTSHIRLLELFV